MESEEASTNGFDEVPPFLHSFNLQAEEGERVFQSIAMFIYKPETSTLGSSITPGKKKTELGSCSSRNCMYLIFRNLHKYTNKKNIYHLYH